MNTVAVIQARMGSSRLPGKVLMDLGGETTLARVVRRLQRSRQVTKIVVARPLHAAIRQSSGNVNTCRLCAFVARNRMFWAATIRLRAQMPLTLWCASLQIVP